MRLPDLSFRLLDLLASRAPGDVPYDEIERAVWNARVTRETIKQRVKLLRESLAPLGAPEPTIEAVRNVGYRTTLEIGLVEPRPWHAGRRLPFALFATIVVVAAVAILIAVLPRATETMPPPTLLVESAAPAAGVDVAAWEGARRLLVRDLSKVEGIRVVDRRAQDREPALLTRLALDHDGAGLRLSTELVDGKSGTILFAENYRYDPRNVDRALAHFANNAHAIITALSLQLGSNGFTPQPDAVRATYARAFQLWRQGDRRSLGAARSILQELLADRGDIPLAASLLTRVKADLVLRHDADIGLAREARRDAARLVAARPDIGEFRYSLARTLIALRDRGAALDQLRIAQQTMPFLSRDIQVLEQSEPRSY